MKTLVLAVLLLTHDARDLTLSRELLEDAAIRNDDAGLQLVRDRLGRLVAESNDPAVLREAHYLIALAASMELFTGYLDSHASAALIASGIHHADRAIALDPKYAEAWMISAMLRGSARRFGVPVPADPPDAPNRFARALELDANAPGVATFAGMIRAMNPAGPAGAEGVKIFEQLVARLDADRAATGRRFRLWDAQAHAWMLFVRMASDDPQPAALRPAAARLLEQRPDFALARQIAETLAERKFVAAPDIEWQPLLSDARGDGKNPKLPDVVAVERAERGERLWYRVTFAEPLPRSFGVNLVFDRDGDPATGMPWWGGGSTFRFDRLVTAWITRDGDRFSGTVGITDDDGARAAKLMKLSTDIEVAIGEHSVILGIPREVLGLTDKHAMVAAGGSHLAWNDDATSASNSR